MKVLLSALFAVSSLVASSSAAPLNFEAECQEETYYSTLPTDTSQWTPENLGPLLKSTHRNRLPYTSTNFDAWDALIDVDIGSSTDTVRLIYKETDVSSLAQ